MKCQRCGNDPVKSESRVMEKASGPDATITLTLQGKKGKLLASVCEDCAKRLRKLGWK